MSKMQNFLKGIIKENPIFVLLLGMCPTLAISNTVENAIGMGIAFTVVLLLSNIIISLIRNFVPDEVRIPSYIVVIASLVTMVEFAMHAFAVDLYDSLGLFIPLIIVNCIILGRAESYASKNNPLNSAIDALGMGAGFTLGLMLIATFRELLGNGTWLGFDMQPFNLIEPAGIFASPPGAFLTLGLLLGIINAIKNKKAKKATE
ncbi:electron transport complex subunit RsxE [Haloplasma contractile]|uniref:Ion-translocating oxidoreductase complex subunit E n=1 Tax=Haloplasma contractile SSD-17B TaxID=1033810 RepID=U2E083_9MOLU|nr:electron transport complex subunit E [Haloplasma contractile]ERJ13837.1 Electron transport complex protein [Haloplasma contractile SSD-17B]